MSPALIIPTQLLEGAAVSLLPVLLFVAALRVLDSFKLVRARALVLSLVVGAGVAVACMFINVALMNAGDVDARRYSLFVAPAVEEIMKGSFIIALIAARRTGFLVDTAIHGFAIGAGFAVAENLFYILELQDSNLLLWLVRGFGTGMMHGAATSLVGIVGKTFAERVGPQRPWVYLPGLLIAIIIHGMFNQFFIPAVMTTAVILLALPLLMIVVFERSERATRQWLGVGFDTDREVLEMLSSGDLRETRIGAYLHSLQDRFSGVVLADMLCYLRLHVELAISAKGVLLMREAGFEVEPDQDVLAKFEELRYLEKSLGATGKLAMHPFLHTSSRDLWQMHLLRR
jgi:protease PrsW